MIIIVFQSEFHSSTFYLVIIRDNNDDHNHDHLNDQYKRDHHRDDHHNDQYLCLSFKHFSCKESNRGQRCKVALLHLVVDDGNHCDGGHETSGPVSFKDLL